MRKLMEMLVFALAVALGGSLAVAEQMIQTGNGKIYQVPDAGTEIKEVTIDASGHVLSEQPVPYNADKNGQIIKLIGYGDDGLIVYSSRGDLLMRKGSAQTFSVFGSKWKIRGMAVIGSDLFIVNTEGNLAKKNIETQKMSSLLKGGAWAAVSDVIGVDGNLVIFKGGRLIRVAPADLTEAEIGSGWNRNSTIAPFDAEHLVVVTPEDRVHLKNVITGKHISVGKFQQGMEIRDSLLFKKSNIASIARVSVAQREDTKEEEKRLMEARRLEEAKIHEENRLREDARIQEENRLREEAKIREERERKVPPKVVVAAAQILPADERVSVRALRSRGVQKSDYRSVATTSNVPALMNWINIKISDYGVKASYRTIKDGWALCALADILEEGAFLRCETPTDLPPEWVEKLKPLKTQAKDAEAVKRIFIAIKILSDKKVPELIDVEDVEYADSQSLYTYLAEVYKKIEDLSKHN